MLDKRTFLISGAHLRERVIAPVSCVDYLLTTTRLHAFDSVQPVLHLSTNVDRQSISTQILHLGNKRYDSCVLSQHINDEPVHT